MSSLTSSKRSNLVWQIAILLVVLGLSAWILIVLGVFNPTDKVRHVKFKVVASSGMANVQASDSTNRVNVSSMVTSPWEQSADYQNGDEVYLTASNPSQTGTLTCTISINSNIWKTESTNSPGDKVACAGIIP